MLLLFMSGLMCLLVQRLVLFQTKPLTLNWKKQKHDLLDYNYKHTLRVKNSASNTFGWYIIITMRIFGVKRFIFQPTTHYIQWTCYECVSVRV